MYNMLPGLVDTIRLACVMVPLHVHPKVPEGKNVMTLHQEGIALRRHKPCYIYVGAS